MQRHPSTASAADGGWRVHTISKLTVKAGDEIAVEVTKDGSEAGKLDYVQLNRIGSPGSGNGSNNSGRF
jgi:hypothetical protein